MRHGQNGALFDRRAPPEAYAHFIAEAFADADAYAARAHAAFSLEVVFGVFFFT